MEERQDFVFKVLAVGDSAAGKSTFIQRWTDEMFIEDCGSTIGVDFKVSLMPCMFFSLPCML